MDNASDLNMRLTITALTEEVALYRNGTTSGDLMEIIKEKDAEAKTREAQLITKTMEGDKAKSDLKKLIHTSRKALVENDTLTARCTQAEQDLASMTSKYDEAAASLTVASETLRETAKKLQITTQQLDEATARNAEDADMITKFQEQGIVHVKNMNTLKNTCGDMEILTRSLRRDLHKAEMNTWKDKEKITELQLENRDVSTQFLKAKESHAETSTTAHKLLASKCREVDTLTETVAELQKTLCECNAAHQHTEGQKDDQIREVKLQLERMESSHIEYVQTSQHTLISREEHWQNEFERLENLNKTNAIRMKQFEAEQATQSHNRREKDTLVARNKELEDKIRRQEQFMKTRMLRDRGGGNHLSGGGPEGSAKPRPLVGGGGHVSHPHMHSTGGKEFLASGSNQL